MAKRTDICCFKRFSCISKFIPFLKNFVSKKVNINKVHWIFNLPVYIGRFRGPEYTPCSRFLSFMCLRKLFNNRMGLVPPDKSWIRRWFGWHGMLEMLSVYAHCKVGIFRFICTNVRLLIQVAFGKGWYTAMSRCYTCYLMPLLIGKFILLQPKTRKIG